jgi:hypothetical protein
MWHKFKFLCHIIFQSVFLPSSDEIAKMVPCSPIHLYSLFVFLFCYFLISFIVILFLFYFVNLTEVERNGGWGCIDSCGTRAEQSFSLSYGDSYC